MVCKIPNCQGFWDKTKTTTALVFTPLWAKWWKQRSDQICQWIHKASTVNINLQSFFLKFSFITVLCAAIWMTGWFCCDEQKILSYNRIFNKCSMTPPNVLNVSNYFKDFYNVWYWQINILWYGKYKIRKFRENWINLVASFAGVIYCRLLPFPFDESIHVIYSENFNYIYWKIWDEFISKKYKEI